MNRNVMKRIVAMLVALIVLYGCSQEEEPQIATEKAVAPLTVSTARSLYEQYVGKSSRLKSVSERADDEFLNILPNWNSAQLFSDSSWYVVESPLDFGTDRKMIFLTKSLMEYLESTKNYEQATQLMRQVFLQNRQTGEVYTFMMIVMPEKEYLLTNESGFEANTYLDRNSRLSGTVLFLDNEGSFINGWDYTDGVITSGWVSEKYDGHPWLKSAGGRLDNCVPALEWAEDGGWAAGVYCDNSGNSRIRFLDMEQFGSPSDGGGGSINPNYPSLPVDGGGGAATGTNTNTSDKAPEKRTDCTSQATANAKNVANILNNINIKASIASLRMNAKTNSATEYGVGISFDSGYGTYSITGGTISQGTPGSNNGSANYTQYTVLTAHTHYTGLNAAPSCGDVIATVKFYKSIREGGGNYKATVSFAADGKEYMIYVNDPATLEKFYKGLSNNDFYERGGKNGDEFKDKSIWADTYDEIKGYMKSKGYSENDAQSYALSYVLDYYNTGLKISSRQGATSDFKEQKTATEGTGKNLKYKPTICP